MTISTPAPTGSADPVFELDGGRVCLDFANTLGATMGEHIHVYADLVAFASQSSLLTPDDAAWLREEGVRDAGRAGGVMVRARRLRAAIYAMFSAIAAGKAPRSRDVAVLNGELAVSLNHARVVPTDDDQGSGAYRWVFAGRNMEAPLWGIVKSAADLLVSDEDRKLIRECGGLECTWLFLDTSKNRTRQWCSMQSCGNREKARRHYQRVRQQLGHRAADAESAL